MKTVSWFELRTEIICKPLNSKKNRFFFWKATSCSVNQEIPNILCNLKVHYRVHKSLPLASVLHQINPVHKPNSISCIFILILSSRLRLGLPNRLLPSDFPPTKTQYAPLLYPVRATRSVRLIHLALITRITFCEEHRPLSFSLCIFLQFLSPLPS